MEIQNFYSSLYDTKIHNEIQTTDNLKYVKNKISAEEAKEHNKPFTEGKISKAIKQMNNEKSPGEDGLTKEFYHTSLYLLSAELSELFNNIKLSHSTPKSWKNAIVKLLFKKNDYRKLKNWRPISLLNVDYKIMSKTLSNRLDNYMDKLVPQEQKMWRKRAKNNSHHTKPSKL